MAERRGNPNEPYEALKRVGEEARRHQDREAYLNIAFYLNEQYVDFVGAADDSRLARIPEASMPKGDDARTPYGPVINKIMHFVQEQTAYAMQSKPTADVLPANLDYLSLGDANVANAYIQSRTGPEVMNWDRELYDAITWAMTANTAYIKWCWEGEQREPRSIFVPSVDLVTDPYATDFYKARWVIHTQFLDPEQVYNAYGVEVPANSVERSDLQKTALLREMGQAPVMNGVTVNELWMLPSRRHPKGLYRVWSGPHTLIESDTFPYEHGGKGKQFLPFTKIGVIPRPRSQFDASPVTFLRAPQVELNKYHWQRLMTRENWALLKLWLPEELQLEEPWHNGPFQIIRGSSPTGQPPQFLNPGSLPDNGDGQWLVEEMNNVGGVRDVSRGDVPGRVEAARAIELLRESDIGRLAYCISTTATTIQRGFWQMLMLARQYEKEEVVATAYSKDGVPEVHHFMTEQFDPGMRIKVTTGSGLANGRAARLEQLGVLWDRGIIRDAEQFAELADIPTSTVLSTKAYDVQEARNENLQMAKGDAVDANSWDDHTIHLREHNNFRKTAEFKASSNKTKQVFEFHCQRHEKLEMAQLQKDAEKALLIAQTTGQAPPPMAEPEPGGVPDQDQAETVAAEA